MTTYKRSAEKPFGYYGFRSVHIELRIHGDIWDQRHVWTREDGSIDIERWIPTRPGFNWKGFEHMPYREIADEMRRARAPRPAPQPRA